LKIILIVALPEENRAASAVRRERERTRRAVVCLKDERLADAATSSSEAQEMAEMSSMVQQRLERVLMANMTESGYMREA
jgi:hypothetical protein